MQQIKINRIKFQNTLNFGANSKSTRKSKIQKYDYTIRLCEGKNRL
jgi:hypothetical protein